MILLILLSCRQGDIGIVKVYDKPADSAVKDTQAIVNEPSAQPTEEPLVEPERSGVTGYTNLHLRQVACPACMGESQEISITFTAQFHQPISDNHTEWIPASGQCTTNLIGVSPSTNPISVGPSITIDSGVHNFGAEQISNGVYETTSIWESQLQRDTLYQVQTQQGEYDFISTHGFDFIEPYTMLWVDPIYAFEAPIYRSGATFTWAPTSIDSTFMITIAIYSWDGSQFLGYVTCSGPDNGSMVIPAQYLQSYQAGSLAAIHLERHKVNLVETSINNSYIETHMSWEVIGTGTIY
tara:strand:- start:2338 stop:3225 length:888 start_codon:yes stop_codon:yes gene_type:complete